MKHGRQTKPAHRRCQVKWCKWPFKCDKARFVTLLPRQIPCNKLVYMIFQGDEYACVKIKPKSFYIDAHIPIGVEHVESIQYDHFFLWKQLQKFLNRISPRSHRPFTFVFNQRPNIIALYFCKDDFAGSHLRKFFSMKSESYCARNHASVIRCIHFRLVHPLS